jgi:hypothetical protein
LLCNICRYTPLELKTILSILKRWKTTSREEELNVRRPVITGIQLNLLCNNCRYIPLELITFFKSLKIGDNLEADFIICRVCLVWSLSRLAQLRLSLAQLSPSLFCNQSWFPPTYFTALLKNRI